MTRTAFSLVATVVLAVPSLGGTALAAGDDSSYGRIAGDFSTSAALGASFGPRAPRGALDLRLRYLWTAGIFATYEDGPLFGANADPRRAFATGVELRPLFLARWLQGLELDNAYLDLTIDSVGLELGAVFLEPPGSSFGSRTALQAGLGMQIPLLPRASGPLLGVHAGARWSDAALGGQGVDGPSDRSLYFLVTIGFQQVFGGASIVDIGDRGSR